MNTRNAAAAHSSATHDRSLRVAPIAPPFADCPVIIVNSLRSMPQYGERRVEPETVEIKLQIRRVPLAADPQHLVLWLQQSAKLLHHPGVQRHDLVSAGTQFLLRHRLSQMLGRRPRTF